MKSVSPDRRPCVRGASGASPRRLVLTFACAFALGALAACGSAERPVVVPAQPAAPAATAEITPSAAPPPPPVAAPTPKPSGADTSLPPPRPTTISLAKTGDEKLDALLAQGDKAFEEGDLARAGAAYKQALTAAPRKAAPLVGGARVRVSKASPSLGFAAAEKNPPRPAVPLRAQSRIRRLRSTLHERRLANRTR